MPPVVDGAASSDPRQCSGLATTFPHHHLARGVVVVSKLQATLGAQWSGLRGGKVFLPHPHGVAPSSLLISVAEWKTQSMAFSFKGDVQEHTDDIGVCLLACHNLVPRNTLVPVRLTIPLFF